MTTIRERVSSEMPESGEASPSSASKIMVTGVYGDLNTMDGLSDQLAQQGPEVSLHGGDLSDKFNNPKEVKAMTIKPPRAKMNLFAAELGKKTRERLISGEIRCCLLELCCEPGSELCREVPQGCVGVRITACEDLTSKDTKRELHKRNRVLPPTTPH